MSSLAPQIHPHLVLLHQADEAADAGHLAAVVAERIGLVGVIQRHHLLTVLQYGAPSASVHSHTHDEVVESCRRAGEDARVGVVASPLVERHIGELQDSVVLLAAVVDSQLCCEGHWSACVGRTESSVWKGCLAQRVQCDGAGIRKISQIKQDKSAHTVQFSRVQSRWVV